MSGGSAGIAFWSSVLHLMKRAEQEYSFEIDASTRAACRVVQFCAQERLSFYVTSNKPNATRPPTRTA